MTTPQLAVNYDTNADVLYLALGKFVSAETDMDNHGLLVRYADSDGQPCGVTVMGFRSDKWSSNFAKLSKLIGNHLGIPSSSVAIALNSVN